MKLFLIRHAETVDNVAGLYAGVRDSQLTVHGVDQANRLGQHLAKTGVVFTHIFASPLTRTSKTAESIRKAQHNNAPPDIVKVPALIEQNFGQYEGWTFQARAADFKKTGRESHREKHKDDPGFVDVESKESMAKRADQFLDEHLIPLFNGGETGTDEYTVAIVSHGMLLSSLWRRLLLRLPRRSLKIAAEVTAARGDVILEHLGGWSNTGYLQLSIRKNDKDTTFANTDPDKVDSTAAAAAEKALHTLIPPPTESDAVSATVEATAVEPKRETSTDRSKSIILTDYSTKILAIDNKQHLSGLKRQRGGIGRSAHDESQKKLSSFFTKKQRLD
ncbi:hypothetical protein Q7P37_004156 [Cladosporium fusiforme]